MSTCRKVAFACLLTALITGVISIVCTVAYIYPTINDPWLVASMLSAAAWWLLLAIDRHDRGG